MCGSVTGDAAHGSLSPSDSCARTVHQNAALPSVAKCIDGRMHRRARGAPMTVAPLQGPCIAEAQIAHPRPNMCALPHMRRWRTDGRQESGCARWVGAQCWKRHRGRGEGDGREERRGEKTRG